MTANARERAAVVAAYILMCAIWGTTWFGIKISLRFIPPIAGAGLRFVVAGLLMYVVAAFGRKIVPLRDIPWRLVLVLSAFLFGINYILTYTAETHVGSGLTAVLFGVSPFFIFAFGHYLIGERTTPLTWLGGAIALGGVALISLSAGAQGSVVYALAAVAAALCAAFAVVYAKRHAHNDPLVTLPPAMLLAGIVIAAIGFAVERPDPSRAFSASSWAALLYLAILGSGLAFFLNLWLLQRTTAWIVGLSGLIIPVIAIIVGVLAGGETFGTREAIGVVLVIGGVWLSLKST
jgi:putative membrane protein PagO